MIRSLLAFFAVLCGSLTLRAQVFVSGQLSDANGMPVSVVVANDLDTVVTVTDAWGYFSDSIAGSASAVVSISFDDCNGITQDTILQVSFWATVTYTDSYCPYVSVPITVTGQVDGIDGGTIDVGIHTPAMALTDTIWVTTNSQGFFTVNVPVYDQNTAISLTWYDCNSLPISLITTPSSVPGTTIVTGLEYCALGILCSANFSTVYCPCDTAFKLELDSATEATAVSYSWNFGDGTSSTDQYPIHTFQENGVFDVCLTATNDIGSTCTYCRLIGADSLGNIFTRTEGSGFTIAVYAFGTRAKNAEAFEPSFKLYPNPVNDVATLQLQSNVDGDAQILLHNAVGQLHRTWTVAVTKGNNEVNIPLQKITKGIYLMSVRIEGNTISRTFAK